MVLYVVEHQVGVFENVLVVTLAYAAGVDAGVYPLCFEQLQTRQQKVRLSEGLTTGEGNASAGRFKIRPEAEQPFDQGLGRSLLSAGEGLSVRIVAVEAAERAALKKDHCPYTGAVHQSHTLQRMNESSHEKYFLSALNRQKRAQKSRPPGPLFGAQTVGIMTIILPVVSPLPSVI